MHVFCFLGVINAWVRCGKVERAEEILKRMENFSSQGHTNMSPNVISYSTVMDGWAKAIFDKDSIAKMENVFHRLIVVHKDGNNNAQPNLFSFVVLIGGYTKKRQQQQQQQQRTNLQKAETIVRRMNEDYGVKPNTQIVTMIVDAWKRSGLHDAGVEAEKILDWLIAIYSDQKDKDLAPNQYTFSCKSTHAYFRRCFIAFASTSLTTWPSFFLRSTSSYSFTCIHSCH